MIKPEGVSDLVVTDKITPTEITQFRNKETPFVGKQKGFLIE
jgi:hypothetical protein